jgi:dynein heavy chain
MFYRRVCRFCLNTYAHVSVFFRYYSLLNSLDEFTATRIEEWGKDVESSSQAKLKLPLLRRDAKTRHLSVNFDSDLSLLLREVKYFLLLGLDVPESALKVFKQAEVFRQWTGNLTLIVDMYNGMLESLLPVEQPLVQGHLDKIDKIVRKGIEQMNWKSNGIDLFIQESMTCVKTADTILNTLKVNLQKSEDIMEQWTHAPLFQREAKPMLCKEYGLSHRTVLKQRYPMFKEGGHKVLELLKETNKVLKVSQGQPDWKAYVDFVNNAVVEGTKQRGSLQFVLAFRVPVCFSLLPWYCSLPVIYSSIMPLTYIHIQMHINTYTHTHLHTRTRALSVLLNFCLFPGVVAAVQMSLQTLKKQLDPAELEKSRQLPLLEIALTLVNDEVKYLPQLFENEDRTGVRDIVDGWIDSFFHVATLFRRLDTHTGTYLKELQGNLETCTELARVVELLHSNEADMIKFREMFETYSYLWTTDLTVYVSMR